MSEKPSYEELEQRVLELENIVIKRKQAEDSLQQVVERANAILDSVSDAIFSLDNDLVVTYFNKAAEHILCRKSHEVLGRYLFDVFPEARGSVFDEKYHQAVKEKIPLFFETFFPIDPYRNWYEVRVFPQLEGISVLFQVITERKQVMQEIQNLAKFPSENPNPVLRLRHDGILLYANEASKALFQDWHCDIGGYAPAFWSDLIIDAIKDRSNRTVDVHFGNQTYAFDIAPIPDTNYVNIYGRDITKSKLAEDALQKSESRLRSMFEEHGAIMLLVEPASGQIVDANQAAQDFYGYSLQSLKEMTIQDINVLMPAQVAQNREEAVRAKQNYFVFPHRLANGDIRTVEVHSSPIAIGGRKLLFSIIHDITERKRIEDQLKASLAEKEVLIKEVHHRVKNNLQIISSLISLQTDSLADEKLLGVLSDVRDRVRAMALVHEKLYQTKDLARIDFAEYAPSLLQYLWRAYCTAVGNVSLNMLIAPLILPVEIAVHCGLILNELSTNAIKHAFPAGSHGEVTVTLDHDHDTGAACLRVKDNGIGMPSGFDWRKSCSLGLRIVKMLAEQMHGTVQTGSGPGTEFQIRFNAKGIYS